MVGMNWRSRPLGYHRIFESWMVRGQCHPFPRSGSHRSACKRPGNEAVSDAGWSPAGLEQIPHNLSRNRVTHRTSELWRKGGEHSRSKTDHCYCEPVWWERIPRPMDDKRRAAQSARCRNREGGKGNHSSRTETTRWKAPGKVMTAGGSIRFERTGGSGNGIVRLRRERQCEG
jgi:hypothetical protein